MPAPDVGDDEDVKSELAEETVILSWPEVGSKPGHSTGKPVAIR
jgi:hypothetical protein